MDGERQLEIERIDRRAGEPQDPDSAAILDFDQRASHRLVPAAGRAFKNRAEKVQG